MADIYPLFSACLRKHVADLPKRRNFDLQNLDAFMKEAYRIVYLPPQSPFSIEDSHWQCTLIPKRTDTSLNSTFISVRFVNNTYLQVILAAGNPATASRSQNMMMHTWAIRSARKSTPRRNSCYANWTLPSRDWPMQSKFVNQPRQRSLWGVARGWSWDLWENGLLVVE